MRRVVAGLALALMASVASAQVTQTGSIFWNGGWAPPQPTTQYLQSCNGGAGGIVGQGSCTGSGGGGGGGGAVTAAAGAYAPGSITDIGTGASPSANTVNYNLRQIETTLGSPFQSGGSIGNTGFNALQGGAANSLTNPFYTAPATGSLQQASGSNGGAITTTTSNALQPATEASGKVTSASVAVSATTSTTVVAADTNRIGIAIQCSVACKVSEVGATLTSAVQVSTEGGTVIAAGGYFIPQFASQTAYTVYMAAAGVATYTNYDR